MDRRDFLKTMLLMVAGLLIWAAHFTFLYAFNTLNCTRPFDNANILGFGIVPFVIALATLLALGGTGAVLVSVLSSGASLRQSVQDAAVTDHFLRYTTAAIAVISLIAIAWNGVPAILVPPCG